MTAFSRVCVTGASGYVGSHVVMQLLAKGFNVRAVVRNSKDEAKTKHLRALTGASERLEIVEGDIENAQSLTAAFTGCDGVIHTAAVVKLNAADPMKEIVVPAVTGTLLALRAARSAHVRRFILTSSVASIIPCTGTPPTRPLTEADWSGATMATPYPYGKTLSERLLLAGDPGTPEDLAGPAVVERVAAYVGGTAGPQEGAGEKASGWPFGVAAINPAFVVGPVLAKVHLQSSPQIILELAAGKMPLCPPFIFSFVDVRDVAAAHVAALLSPTFSGRAVVAGDTVPLLDACHAMRAHFPAGKFPTRGMWQWVFRGYALMDKRVPADATRWCRPTHFANGRLTGELGVPVTPWRQALADTVQSFVEIGALPGATKQ